MDAAFKNFWSRRKEGIGFPRFKKKSSSKESFKLSGYIKVKDHHIQLPRLGVIRVKEHIDGRVKGKILSATVSRSADKWFVSICTVEENLPDPNPVIGPVVGIDLGLKTFATLSDGMKIGSPSPLRDALTQLRRAQREYARKRKGSNNRRKSALKIAKIHAKVSKVRKDFLHKITTRLAKTKSVIVIEDLHIKGMVKNHSLAQRILDQGWSEFGRQLSYKTAWYGSKLVTADRWYPSSKLCSDCGHTLKELPLSIREWTCPSCGCVHDRDGNAAINLERFPYREFPGNVKPVEIPLAAELGKPRSTNHGSLKQEAGVFT